MIIKNSMLRQKGFTLIEVLIAIGIIVAISGVAGDTFFSVYRNYTKANLTLEAKQQGNSVLSLAEKSLRDALNVSTISSQVLQVTKRPNIYEEIGCVSGSVSTNGYIYSKVGSASSPESKLTNDDLRSGVNVKNCVFSVDYVADKPTVKTLKIYFELTQSVSAPSRVEFQSSIPFELTLVLRNQ